MNTWTRERIDVGSLGPWMQTTSGRRARSRPGPMSECGPPQRIASARFACGERDLALETLVAAGDVASILAYGAQLFDRDEGWA